MDRTFLIFSVLSFYTYKAQHRASFSLTVSSIMKLLSCKISSLCHLRTFSRETSPVMPPRRFLSQSFPFFFVTWDFLELCYARHRPNDSRNGSTVTRDRQAGTVHQVRIIYRKQWIPWMPVWVVSPSQALLLRKAIPQQWWNSFYPKY